MLNSCQASMRNGNTVEEIPSYVTLYYIYELEFRKYTKFSYYFLIHLFPWLFIEFFYRKSRPDCKW